MIVRIVRILIVVILSEVDLLLLVVFRHIRQNFLNTLLARLSPQDKQVELVCLQLYNNFGHSSLEVQSGQKLPIIFLGKLFFTQFDAHDRLEFVLNLGVRKNNVAIND